MSRRNMSSQREARPPNGPFRHRMVTPTEPLLNVEHERSIVRKELERAITPASGTFA